MIQNVSAKQRQRKTNLVMGELGIEKELKFSNSAPNEAICNQINRSHKMHGFGCKENFYLRSMGNNPDFKFERPQAR